MNFRKAVLNLLLKIQMPPVPELFLVCHYGYMAWMNVTIHFYTCRHKH